MMMAGSCPQVCDLHVACAGRGLAERRREVVEVGIARRRVGVVSHKPVGKAACPPTRVRPGDGGLAERRVTQCHSVRRVGARFIREQIQGSDLCRDGALLDQGPYLTRVVDAATGDYRYVDHRKHCGHQIKQCCGVRVRLQVPGAPVATGVRALEGQRSSTPDDSHLSLIDRCDGDR